MKSLIFDVDGTILDSMPMWLELENNLLEKYGYTMASLDKEVKDTIESLSIEGMSKYIADTIAKDMTFKEVYHYFRSSIDYKYSNEVEVKEGAIEIIKNLYDKGVQLSVASSSSSDCIIKAFKRIGIYDYFRLIATADNTGLKKSQREFWITLAKKLQRDPDQIILYDDSLYAIETAKKVGIEVVGIKDFPCNETDWEEIVSICSYTLDTVSDIRLDQLI
ncbi:HAD family phosphatase [Anaerococcus sp.]|uniref:HAD family hydrolase n=1 Tax=Anaerococcus sp. TaxID=1872515 RepID=UPI0027BA4BE1|nr:HAD-IA family hydrolase [Anaerococcus sp.]